MKKILVTGGAGFIGSNFVRYLLDNYPDYKVVVLDALTYAGTLDNFSDKIKSCPRFEFWHGNVRHSQLVGELVDNADIVVHMAAESHVARSIYDDTLFFETDVLGTQTLANAVLTHPVERFIHISTSEVYGSALSVPMAEDHPLNPMSPYASAKTGADRLVYSYVATYNIPAIIVRPFNNFGPHQHLEKVIPRFITSAIMDEPLTVHGDGESSRDWVYVDDHCKAIDCVMHCPIERVKGEVLNVATGVDYKIRDIAEIIIKKMGKDRSLITHTENRPGQVSRHVGSTSKAAALLGWKAEIDFLSGLDKAIRWYKENEAWWKRLLWMRAIPMRKVKGKLEIY